MVFSKKDEAWIAQEWRRVERLIIAVYRGIVLRYGEQAATSTLVVGLQVDAIRWIGEN